LIEQLRQTSWEEVVEASGLSRPQITAAARIAMNAHQLSRTKPRAGQYLSTTIRSHDQFNTSIYGLDDRYRGIYNGRRVIFMNEGDMKADGFVQGHLVDITSHFEGKTRTVERFMLAPYPIPTRCLAGYYPETNPLVHHAAVAEKSNCPASKSVAVTLKLSALQGRTDWEDVRPGGGT